MPKIQLRNVYRVRIEKIKFKDLKVGDIACISKNNKGKMSVDLKKWQRKRNETIFFKVKSKPKPCEPKGNWIAKTDPVWLK